MPQMDGLELMCAIREMNDSVRFIVISGYKEFEYTKVALTCGAMGYVLKPIDIDELLSVLDRALRDVFKERQRANMFSENTFYHALLYDQMLPSGGIHSASWLRTSTMLLYCAISSDSLWRNLLQKWREFSALTRQICQAASLSCAAMIQLLLQTCTRALSNGRER